MKEKIELQIDQCVWINLDSRIDRKEHMESLLENCSWSCQRLSATRLTGELHTHNVKMVQRLEGKNGVASIWISHKRALNLILKQGGTSAGVILEDDLRLPNQEKFWLENQSYQLPRGLGEDWEILLLSPKFRYKDKATAEKNGCHTYFAPPPLNGMAVRFKDIIETYIITGAHFVIFRNPSVVAKVIQKMNEVERLYDVDEFYVKEFSTYGYSTDDVTHGGFGSDHN